MGSLDWKSILIIPAFIAGLAVTAKWWLPSLLSTLEGWRVKAVWKSKDYALIVDRPQVASADRAASQADLLTSQITSVTYRVAVLNQSTVVHEEEARALVSALQTQVHRDLAPVWGVDAHVTFVPPGAQPPQSSWLVVILDDTDRAGALAYRDLTAEGLPLAKVFAQTAKSAGCEWTVSASHQVLELLLNPRLNLTVYAQFGEATTSIYTYEICNPCEADRFGYRIDGTLVSDFVHPAWFEPARKPNSNQFDHCRHISAPFQILEGGYVTKAEIRGDWQFVTGPSAAPTRKRKAAAS